MTQAETNTPAPRRAPRWMKILLGVSLAFNVAVLAAVAGFAIRHGGPDGGAGFRDIRGFARFVPEARRDAAREVLERHREEYGATRERMHAARAAAVEVFLAEPYDAEALQRALAEMSAASEESRALSYRAMAEIGAMLTPEERAEVIEKFRERGRRWRERRAGRPGEAADGDDR